MVYLEDIQDGSMEAVVAAANAIHWVHSKRTDLLTVKISDCYSGIYSFILAESCVASLLFCFPILRLGCESHTSSQNGLLFSLR
jgi:hypothetical protein